jgi:hypothetical protein
VEIAKICQNKIEKLNTFLKAEKTKNFSKNPYSDTS